MLRHEGQPFTFVGMTGITTTPGWNIAEIWEHHAERFPDAAAQISDAGTISWSAFDRRADGIAATLLAGGAGQQDKVAQYLYNCPEFLESTFGIFKAGLVPVNTNYRYTDDELIYLWSNADAVAVVFHGTFADRCEQLRHRLKEIATWIWVDDGTLPCPAWATDYEVAAASADARVIAPWGRSPDDLFLLYTGGTTGMPKGVMWRQDDVIGALDSTSREKLPTVPGWDELDRLVPRPGPRNLPAAPLMHGTGVFNAMWNLCIAGTVITMRDHSFSPERLLDSIERHRVNSMSMVGDAFGKPILRALDAEPDRWDISSMRVIVSSGVMWSSETKAGLLRHNPRLILIDSLGSSEAIGMGSSRTTADGSRKAATFTLSEACKVLTEDGREVAPGGGERGRVAIRGRTPIGYYKDPEKSAGTFIVYDGVRWTIPGDFAEVDADGTVRLLGRGSQCINTGGEKVYPEEVEEALKSHVSVHDAAVVGLADDRFGEAITALVQLSDNATLDEAALITHVRTTLAAFKSPKRVFAIADIGRAANGKLDYRSLKSIAEKMSAAG